MFLNKFLVFNGMQSFKYNLDLVEREKYNKVFVIVRSVLFPPKNLQILEKLEDLEMDWTINSVCLVEVSPIRTMKTSIDSRQRIV